MNPPSIQDLEVPVIAVMNKKILSKIRNRVSGPSAELLKEDIKSFFKQTKITTLGFVWYFCGSNKFFNSVKAGLYEEYYDAQENCLNVDGIKLPYAALDELSLFSLYDILGHTYLPLTNYCFKSVNEAFCLEGPQEYKSAKLKTNDIVIDAGANVGIFSAFASNKCCADNECGRVYAFEPVPENIKILEQTAALNKGIVMMPYALSDTSSVTDIYLDSKGISTHTIIRELSQKSMNKIQIQTTTLDHFVHQNNIPRIDFIKSDIEGAERYMLMGAKQVLKDFAPKLAICTYHLPDDPKVLRELILDANPNYVIEERWKKMYAHVPG